MPEDLSATPEAPRVATVFPHHSSHITYDLRFPNY